MFARTPLDDVDMRCSGLMVVGPIGAAEPFERDALFRRLGEANLIGVGFGDLVGHATYLNDEMLRMMGRTRADVETTGINFLECIAPECRGEARRQAEALLRDGIARDYALAFVRPDGGRTEYVGAAALVRPEDGFHVSIALDVSRERELERSLRSADRRKNDALAMVAHEIRGPLDALQSGIGLLEHAAAAGDSIDPRLVARLSRQVDRIARMAGDLLDTTRITHGTLSVEARPVDLRNVAQRACDDIAHAFSRVGGRLQLACPSEPVVVQGDPDRLAQVMANLLGNALHHSGRGASVAVSIEVGIEAVLSIRDSGRGIAREYLARVLEPFERGAALDGRGLGLGLAIVDAIVKLHGGRLAIDSAGLGRGTEVLVALPLSGPA